MLSSSRRQLRSHSTLVLIFSATSRCAASSSGLATGDSGGGFGGYLAFMGQAGLTKMDLIVYNSRKKM